MSSPEELFEALLELPPGDREGWLAANVSDPGLREELRSLVHATEARPGALRPRMREAPLPDRIGPYRLVRERGRGGAGVVHEALDERSGRRVALKRLRRDRTRTPTSLADEARLLASITSPVVARLLALERHDEMDVAALELVEGPTLRDRLDAGPLPPEDAARIVRQIAIALETIHARGVLHLDLKPGNVILQTPPGPDPSATGSPRVKVLDFGVGRLDRPGPTGHAAGTGPTVIAAGSPGTPGYLAPEALGGRVRGVPADLFSLGAIGFECFTGCPAIQGSTVTEILAGTLAPAPDWALFPDVAGPLRPLLAACLDPDPAGRPGSATEIRKAVSAWLGTPFPVADDPSLHGRGLEADHGDVLLDERGTLTLVGPGGIGKTRLARELLRRARGRGEAADLIELGVGVTRDALDGVLPILTRSLGLRDVAGVAPLDRLIDALDGEARLLVLDEAEGVRGAIGALVPEIRSRAPGVRILLTAREPLGLRGETVLEVSSLDLPGEDGTSDEALLGSPAARVLLDALAARGVTGSFASGDARALAALVRAVDGHPLALELLGHGLEIDAGRVRVPADGFAGSVASLFGLGELLDRTYHDLPDPERCVLRRLSVFRGGFTPEDAVMVIADDAVPENDVPTRILALAERRLVRVEPGRGNAAGSAVRYRMLEPIRQDATRRLDVAGETDDVVDRHRRHFAELVIDVAPRLRQADQDRWFRRLDDEHANVTAALVDPAGDPELALRAASAMGYFWQVRGHCHEGRQVLERVLAPVTERGTRPFVNAATWAGNLAFHAGDLGAARAGYAAALTWADEVGEVELRARLHLNLGAVHIVAVELDAASRALERAIELLQDANLPGELATAYLNLGVVAERRDDFGAARRHYEESLAIRRTLGDALPVAAALNNLGTVAERDDDLAASIAHHEEALAIRRDLGDTHGIAESLHNLGATLLRSGRVDEAMTALDEALAGHRRRGSARVAETLDVLATACEATDPEEAARRLGEADAIRERHGATPTPSGDLERGLVRKRLIERLGGDRVAALETEGRARGS